MKLKELYSKSITRTVNPAVSATKFDPETERIEIQEYVFTDEIINGLYRILDAIKNNEPYSHVGIWIDGYYGSGKSHFLKYLDYCITPETRDDALARLLEAVKAIDPLDDKHNLQFDYDQIFSIAQWLKKATIDTCIFNLETSYDNSTDKKKAFLHVFWNEFNGKRGFNKFNITLAQNLEKPLQEKGVFEEFKARIAEEGGDWNDPGQAADLIDNELDFVLDIAKELAPTLSVDSIRERIIKRDTNMSIDRFAGELKSYLKDKGEDYRLILLADEVSQFINKERDRYLNLQEIITKLSEECENKVWVACTAQQDLSEIMDECNIAEEKDKEGKIKGRFEVKVSLKGTQPEVITQKRILDKKEEVKDVLAKLYDKNKAAFSLQFKLPNSYVSYDTKEDFIAYYPFVPYQFKLIIQVFDSFLNLGYVAKEVKGNERSIIKVVHATAKASAETEIGKFVSFDELYNNMFEEGLQARGQKAVDNAIKMARSYRTDKPELTRMAVRVANVLFMICNIAQNDQLVFPATLDNVTSLLINDMETPRLNVKNEVEKIIEYLCDNNIIRREQGKEGAPEHYSFYSEEEMKVAELIKSKKPDINTQAELLKEIFLKYISGLKNKEQYCTRSFAVGVNIMQRSFLSNSPDLVVEFAMDNDYDTADMLAINNSPNKMIYYVGPQYRENKRLFNAFYNYCQIGMYMATPVPSPENALVRKEFEKRSKEIFDTLICPQFHKILDSCPIVAGLRVIDEDELKGKKASDRYHEAVQKHLAGIYTKANLVDVPTIARTTENLRKAVLRAVQPGDYEGFNASLTPSEKEVEIYLNKQYGEVALPDVVAKFAKAPYGWDSICTLYVVNELVRRHNRDYSYSNNPNVSQDIVANRLTSETSKFTVRQAAAISAEVINQFRDSWKSIFGISSALGSNDSTQLFNQCRDLNNSNSIVKRREGLRANERDYGRYLFFNPVRDAITMLDEWMNERDPLKFFQAIINKREDARKLFDTVKEVMFFVHDQKDTFDDIVAFVNSNKENFGFVPEDLKPLTSKLISLETKAWPIAIREFIKARRDVEGAISQKREECIEKIKAAYKETYNQLVESATKQGVDTAIITKPEDAYACKISSNLIAVLDSYLNTDLYFQKEAARILDASHPQPLPGSGNGSEGGQGSTTGTGATGGTTTGGSQTVEPKKPRQLSLQTRTIVPLETEQDVDDYLAKLRKQLMAEINNGQSVMIIK